MYGLENFDLITAMTLQPYFLFYFDAQQLGRGRLRRPATLSWTDRPRKNDKA